jgi:transposase
MPTPGTLAAAALTPVGGVLAQTTTRADAAGYQQLLGFARGQVPGRRGWAVEGAGSYGAGLAAFLQQRGERVVESADPSGRRAAPVPTATPGRGPPPPARHLARSAWPGARRRGQREALRALLATRRCATRARVAAIGERKALIVGAPEGLRAELRGASTATQIQRCASSEPDRPARSEHQLTVRALRTTAGAHPVPGRRGRPAPRASAPP